MSKIAALPPKASNQQTINILSELLEKAKAGELHEIVAVCTTSGNGMLTRYTSTHDLFVQLGMAENLKHTIQRRIDGEIE